MQTKAPGQRRPRLTQSCFNLGRLWHFIVIHSLFLPQMRLRCFIETGFAPTRRLSTEGLTFCECQLVFPSCSSSELPCFSPGALSSRKTPSVFIISLPGRKEEGCREQMHRNLLVVATLPRERVHVLPRFGLIIVKMEFVEMLMMSFMASVWMSWAGGWFEFRWTLFRRYNHRREGGHVGLCPLWCTKPKEVLPPLLECGAILTCKLLNCCFMLSIKWHVLLIL